MIKRLFWMYLPELYLFMVGVVVAALPGNVP